MRCSLFYWFKKLLSDTACREDINWIVIVNDKLNMNAASEPIVFKRTWEDTEVLNQAMPSQDSDLSRVSTWLSIRSRIGVGGSCNRRARRRAIFKNGDCNVVQTNMSKRKRRFLQDLFTTLVDIRWRWTLLVSTLAFLLSWLFYALLWWLICFTHGDLEDNGSDWHPCVDGIKSFAAAFLFSLETQHTIGYGYRAITDECPEAIFLLCVQSITGVFIQAFTVGIVFAKMARPKMRSQTLMFSRSAVISLRDGVLALMLRVGDMREKSHLISCSVKAYLLRPRMTKEGEVLSPYLYDLHLHADDYESELFLIWPAVVMHKITDSSPLYDLSAADLLRERFEVVVILEGTAESTGQTTQARTSYLPNEIFWGHRFQQILTFDKNKLNYNVNFSLFHNTTEVETPLCSARDLNAFISLAKAQQEAHRLQQIQQQNQLHRRHGQRYHRTAMKPSLENQGSPQEGPPSPRQEGSGMQQHHHSRSQPSDSHHQSDQHHSGQSDHHHHHQSQSPEQHKQPPQIEEQHQPEEDEQKKQQKADQKVFPILESQLDALRRNLYERLDSQLFREPDDREKENKEESHTSNQEPPPRASSENVSHLTSSSTLNKSAEPSTHQTNHKPQ